LVSGHGTAVRGGNLVVARAFSFHVAVVMGANEAPRAASPGGRVTKASFPARRSEELLGGVLDHGPLWGRRPTAS
jgi:hypothetical protein